MVSRTSEEVTSEPCASKENSEPPKTPATPNMWKGCIRMLSSKLEDQHVVERTRDTQGHRVGERTLTERIDQEDCRLEQVEYNTDPGSHTQTIGQFPLTSHVGVDADEEVEDYELERTTVIQPLVERGISQMG